MSRQEYIRKMDGLIEKATISERDRKIIEEAYYKDGCTFGRDGLYHYIKEKTKDDKLKTPSFRVVAKWLKNQALQQEFQQTRKGGTTDFFHPETPFNSISIDLIDFQNKPSFGNYRYILVVVDNFSRKMFVEPLREKTAENATKGMKKILTRLETESNGKLPKYLVCDDGSEWKGDFIKLLESKNIDKRRTLGGQPQANGLVERSNGKLKMLLAKNMKINGGDWLQNLPKALNAYNNQRIRTTEYTPNEALELKTKVQQQKLINNVESKHKKEFDPRFAESFKVGDTVRVKLSKGVLSKSSTPSWSSQLYTIGRVVKSKTPTVADKYKIKELAQDQNYARSDLQAVEGKPEQIPIKPKLPVEKVAQTKTIGEFTIIEEQSKERAKRERKQTATFDFQKEGRNDTTLRKRQKSTAQAEPAVAVRSSDRKAQKAVRFDVAKEGANDTTRRKQLAQAVEKKNVDSPPRKKTEPLGVSSVPRKAPAQKTLGSGALAKEQKPRKLVSLS